MISLAEFSRSPKSARSGRVLYEDLALVAHLSELERQAVMMKPGARERRASFQARIGLVYASFVSRLSGGTARSLTPQSPVSMK